MARLSGTIAAKPAPRVVIDHYVAQIRSDGKPSVGGRTPAEVTVEQPSSDRLVATVEDPRLTLVISVTARPIGLGSEVDYVLEVTLRGKWRLGAPLLPFFLRRFQTRLEDGARKDLDALA